MKEQDQELLARIDSRLDRIWRNLGLEACPTSIDTADGLGRKVEPLDQRLREIEEEIKYLRAKWIQHDMEIFRLKRKP